MKSKKNLKIENIIWCSRNHEEKIIEVLSAVIERMYGEAEYNALYNSLILGQIGDEEFEDLTEDLICSTKYDENVFFKQELDDTDKEKIDILLQYTKIKYTPTEIGDIFLLNDEIVEKYLEEKHAA